MSGARTGGRLAGLAVYAIAMGHLEATVVVYLRGLLGVPHGAPLPDGTSLRQVMGNLDWMLPTEQGRELATLVMIGAVAYLSAQSRAARIGAFLFVFGTWDLAYYAGLHLLLRWPSSLATRDVLFLLPPGPWWDQPVWLPMAISVVMVALGSALYRKGRARDSSRVSG